MRSSIQASFISAAVFLSVAPASANLLAGTDTGVTGTFCRFTFSGGAAGNGQPYGTSFNGGVRVATGDINGDGISDIITGSGAGAPGGHVKVFSGLTGVEINSFFAFDTGFTGGVFVGSGDVNGDGRDDIITGAGSGSTGGHVKVFSGTSGAEIQSFFAYTGFSGGVYVAAGDINGDGKEDIITGAGSGGTDGHVKAFSGADNSLLQSFFAYAGFGGGVNVAAGDVNGDGLADIVTGSDAGTGGGHVKVFKGSDVSLINSYFAYGTAFSGGVRVGAADINNDGLDDVIMGSGAGMPATLRVNSAATTNNLLNINPFGANYSGGVYVGGGSYEVVPEPTTLAVMSLLGLAACRRKRK